MCCSDSRSAPLLRRKKEQRRCEVKRARRTWHRSKNARLECTAGQHALVHSTALFFILIDLQPWPATPSSQALEHRRVQAWHIDGRARRGSYCAPLMLLVVQTSLVPRRPSNAHVCLILIMC